jgi:hypothetical protein
MCCGLTEVGFCVNMVVEVRGFSFVMEIYNVLGSLAVMFFIFYIMVRWFLRVLEDRIRFVEGLYNELVDEIRLLRREMGLLVSSLRRINGDLVSRLGGGDDGG